MWPQQTLRLLRADSRGRATVTVPRKYLEVVGKRRELKETFVHYEWVRVREIEPATAAREHRVTGDEQDVWLVALRGRAALTAKDAVCDSNAH
eukprot:CAMPEP_0172637132 /NCGR_PEP_ID=MMETSP1068-20121228/207316_1 /TAXON_ID=35684 /ORGANISM="Pseudopedinella elastica, Strain CCMP716" /LENGTH=92 /DNA_ID=CAMNT_0013449701 /DNA_START=123 /DNA_END=401 /DNA_ORIENTATION=+